MKRCTPTTATPPGINSSLNWDPLSWETNEDTDILNNVSSGFYTFVLNSEKEWLLRHARTGC